MADQIRIYVTLIATSGMLSVLLAVYAYFNRRTIPYARTYLWSTASQAIYIFASAFQLTSNSLEEIKFWIAVSYIGMPFAPVFGLLLVLRYTGYKISRISLALMLAIPMITTVLVATNDLHHLFYKSVYLIEFEPTPIADITMGPWYIVHGVYTSGSMLASVLLLLFTWRQTQNAYRLQQFTLICGQLIPMTAAFAYLIQLTPDGLDPVPIVMCFTSGLYMWAIASKRMLTIMPIAKERLFESMHEAVFVLDASDRLVDFNKAASDMLPALGPSLIGDTLEETWFKLTGSAFPDQRPGKGLHEEITRELNGETYYYQARASLVRHPNGETAGSLWMLIDVTLQRKLQDQLMRLAYHDSMTGIYNRAHFIARSKNILDAAKLTGQPVSFILFDIDFFKRVNDTYGHDTGDRLIQHVVDVCQQQLAAEADAAESLFARFGGEEFVVALPSYPLQKAGELAERLRAGLQSNPLDLPVPPGSLAVSASFGVAQLNEESDTLESILRHADAALYTAKRGGRNRVCLHDQHE